MVRRYDSSRRRKAADETRREILEAALKLHWEGVTGFDALAREAGCSVATVRKHFPTKEALFQSCTRRFGETLTMPDLEELAGIEDPSQRLGRGLAELCRIHEAMFGYAWHSAYLRGESPILDAVMRDYEGLADAIARIVIPLDSPRAALARGLVDFLTYRALRLSGKLSPEQARSELTSTVASLLSQSEASVSTNSRKEQRDDHES